MTAADHEPVPGPSDSHLRSAEPWGLSRCADATLIAILLLCVVLPYLNTLLNGFVYDDNNEVLNNPCLRSFGHLKEIFSTNVLAHLGARGVTNYYRPLNTLWFLLCYQVFGPLPYGFHLANVLLHAVVVCLLFWVTERMFHDRTLAFIGAAGFALHPIHTESVAWVSAVTDLELTLFYLLTFWFFLAVARPEGRRSDLAQLGMAGSFLLTILSKEQAVTLPLLATIYEHFYRDDRAETTWVQKVPRYGTLWLLSFGYLLFRMRFFGSFAAVLLMPHITWYEALLSVIPLVGQYLWKLVWPVHLCAFYAFHKSVTPWDPRVLGGLTALALCALLSQALWKRARLVSFGFVWLLVTLAPVLNARWLGPNVLTERYLYLPSVGFCWIVAWAGLRLWAMVSHRSPVARKAFVAAVGLAAVLCAVRVATRNRDWRSDIIYYQRALAAAPDAIGLRINLGAVYWNGGDAAAAEREWRRALKLAPNNALLLNNLGLVCSKQKRFDEAVDYFRRSMRARPNYLDAHLNLGSLYADTGEDSQAELQLRAAVALAPLNIQARNRLGKFYLESGRLAEAEEQFRRAVESGPSLQGYDSLGDIYRRWGRREQAERAFRDALAADLYDSHAHFALAGLAETAGRNAEAWREYQAGLQTDPANPEAQAAVRRLRAQFSHGQAPKN